MEAAAATQAAPRLAALAPAPWAAAGACQLPELANCRSLPTAGGFKNANPVPDAHLGRRRVLLCPRLLNDALAWAPVAFAGLNRCSHLIVALGRGK